MLLLTEKQKKKNSSFCFFFFRPADPDTLIRSIKVTISHLQYSGYHLSVITPTSNFVRAVFKNLFNNEHLVSGNQILSYKNLGSEGVAFAKKQALACKLSSPVYNYYNLLISK